MEGNQNHIIRDPVALSLYLGVPKSSEGLSVYVKPLGLNWLFKTGKEKSVSILLQIEDR